MSHTTTVKLSGISCGACRKVISKRLKKIEGIQEVDVNIENGDTAISATRPVTSDEIIAALDGTHYKVISIS